MNNKKTKQKEDPEHGGGFHTNKCSSRLFFDCFYSFPLDIRRSRRKKIRATEEKKNLYFWVFNKMSEFLRKVEKYQNLKNLN